MATDENKSSKGLVTHVRLENIPNNEGTFYSHFGPNGLQMVSLESSGYDYLREQAKAAKDGTIIHPIAMVPEEHQAELLAARRSRADATFIPIILQKAPIGTRKHGHEN